MSAIEEVMKKIDMSNMKEYIDDNKQFEIYIWRNIYDTIKSFHLERNRNIIKKHGGGFRNAMNLYKSIHNMSLDILCCGVDTTINILATASLYREVYEKVIEKIIDE